MTATDPIHRFCILRYGGFYHTVVTLHFLRGMSERHTVLHHRGEYDIPIILQIFAGKLERIPFLFHRMAHNFMW